MSIALSTPSPRAARAHALKNCLAVVRAVNRLLESDVSERSRERLARSQDAVDRMLAIIQEELTADSRPAARDPGYVSTADMLREVVARVEDRALAGRVELFVQAGPGGVGGDGSELTEAFSNVVLNAIEATPPGGVVLLSIHELVDGQIVERHGRQLDVRTFEGSGTVVSMRLPALAPDAFAEEQSRATSGS